MLILLNPLFWLWDEIKCTSPLTHTVEPLLRGQLDKRPPFLEWPVDNVNLNINVLISTSDERSPLLKGHFSDAKGWPHKRGSTVLSDSSCYQPVPCYQSRGSRSWCWTCGQTGSRADDGTGSAAPCHARYPAPPDLAPRSAYSYPSPRYPAPRSANLWTVRRDQIKVRNDVKVININLIIIIPSTRWPFFVRFSSEKKSQWTSQFLLDCFNTQDLIFYRRQYDLFGAHSTIFCRSYCTVTMAGEVTLLDYVTRIF